MSGAKGIGIPVKLLHEAAGHVVTVRRRGKKKKKWAFVRSFFSFFFFFFSSRLRGAFASSLRRSLRIAAEERSSLLSESRFRRSAARFRPSKKEEMKER